MCQRACINCDYKERISVIKFSDLGLNSTIQKTLEREGYSTPTPIQTKAIPPVLLGGDLLGIAQTGTGKTAAFALPILTHLANNPKPAPHKGCRVLVLTPTRELASQIAKSFKVYGSNLGFKVSVVFGGTAPRPQIRALSEGIDILIATPGRLLDHMNTGAAKLHDTEILVLDEADQMLDMGFVKPIRTVVANIQKNRQTLFFSATMPNEIRRLSREFLTNPTEVSVTPVSSTGKRVSQQVIYVETQKKRSLLTELLSNSEISRAMIFTRTKHGADRVAKHLEISGIGTGVIHGNKSQRQREQALDAFRNSKVRVLVATDIAARGIDINDVSHVINFDLPETPEAYVHRIGRTARAGASGAAISLCDASERKHLRAIERLTNQTVDSLDRRKDDNLPIDVKIKMVRGADPRKRTSRKSEDGSEQAKSGQADRRRNARRRKPKTAANEERRASEGRSFHSANDNNSGAGAGSGANAKNGKPKNGSRKQRTEGKRNDGPYKSRAGGQKRGNSNNARSNSRRPTRAKSA